MLRLAWLRLAGALLCWLGAVVSAVLAATSRLGASIGSRVSEVEARRAELDLVMARNDREADRWWAAFQAAPLAMGKVSPEGRFEAVNAALCSLLGELERSVVGRRVSAFIYPDDLARLGRPGGPRHGGGSERPGHGRQHKAEVRLVCAGGQLRWCELATSLVRDSEGRPEYVIVSLVDITRHKRSQAALRDLATRDPLSGLGNRRWFELELAKHLRTCVDEGPRGALLVVDIDNFKAVNDSLGHQAGDRLVIEVAVTLRRHLRDHDVVARLGGDEFAVIVGEGDKRAAEAVARKLVLAVRDEVRTPSLGGVTVSLGVAPFELLDWAAAQKGASVRDGADTAAASLGRDALSAADEAMYLVKRSGRNGYAVAGPDGVPRHARPRPAPAPGGPISVADLSVDMSGGPSAPRRAGIGVEALQTTPTRRS